MCVRVDTYVRVDVRFIPKRTSKWVPFRSRPQRHQWKGQTGWQPLANDLWGPMTCGVRYSPHQAAADWAEWAVEVTQSRPVITGGLSSGVPPCTNPDFVRLALQARAFSILLSSSPLSQASDCHFGHSPHPQPIAPLCLTAVSPDVSFAHLASWLFLKALNGHRSNC